MKTLTSILIVTLITASCVAQRLPRPSPVASVEQRVGLTDISIKYSSPGVKARTIWGELVPYDKVWRTGANESTLISFSGKVWIMDKEIEEGKYSLFTIPGKTEWTVIINKITDGWGDGKYKEENDVMRFKVKPQDAPFRERMTFLFENTAGKTSEIVLHWEKIKIAFTISVDVDSKVWTEIGMALAEAQNDNARADIYSRAAGYCASSGKKLDQGLEWINKSIELKDYWYSYLVKALVYAAQKDMKNAIKFAEESIKKGEVAYKEKDKEFTYKKKVEEKIAEWKAAK